MAAILLSAIILLVLSAGPSMAQEQVSPAINYAPALDNTSPTSVRQELILEARLTKLGASVEKGLVWRVFSTEKGADGIYPIIADATGGTMALELPAGTYLVHAAFGRAGATKKITLARGGARETFILTAGGLKLDAVAGKVKITSSELRFSIYSSKLDEKNKRKIIARDVPAGTIVRLNAGTYHVVSEYGKINATVRADLRVKAGGLTIATLQHRAAKIALKLVGSPGGEAIADTAWSIVSGQGDVVTESSSPYPSMVLSAGNYTAFARNGGTVYKLDFIVTAGGNTEVEVLAKN